jgi:hypothetical protein
MMKFYRNIINYLFPVLIYKDTDVLTIEDRRISRRQLIFAGSGICLFIFTGILAKELIDAGFWGFVVIMPGVGLFLIIRALLTPFWETYNFDKRKDTYTFVRRSLIKREIEQGSLSQFRAIQIERRLISTDDETTENYHVALLKNGDLLFGSPPRAILREEDSYPIFSDLESESRIAKTIATFLNFSSAEIIDV